MSQLKTVQEPMKLLAPFGITANASTYPVYSPTTTLPTTGGTIQSSPLNYIKISPVFLTAVGATPRFKVTGWNTVASVPPTYIPQLLFEGTVSAQNTTSCVFTPVQSKAVIKGAQALTATLVAGSDVTLTAGTTANLTVGMTFSKNSGAGLFGTSAAIATIVSATQFTVTVPHNTVGAVNFDAMDKIITLPSTAGLVVGQTLVTGSGTGTFGSGATIQSIDSSTQITTTVTNLVPSSLVTPNLVINFRGFTGFYTSATITKTQGDGKIYNATSMNDSAFVLVDTLGCEIVKIEFIGTTTAGGCNAFYGAM